MTRIAYLVSRGMDGDLRIEARVEPGEEVCVLAMRDTYGMARGFSSGIHNLRADNPSVRADAAAGRILAVGHAPFSLAYDCRLPGYAGAGSLLRGFKRGKTLFCPGMALFFRLCGAQAAYEVRFDLPAVSSAQGGDVLHFTDPGELERAYFAFNHVRVAAAGRTRFVHEPAFPFSLTPLVDVWPSLQREMEGIFGSLRHPERTVFLFASGELAAGYPGTGFYLPGGALVSIPSGDEELASPQTLWLLLHETAHQWLGGEVRRSDPADDWFFEGFANFAACAALAGARRLSGPELGRLLSYSGRAALRSKVSGIPAPGHQGFLAARRWDRALKRQHLSLATLLADFVADNRGKTLQGQELSAALARVSPGGTLPDFLKKLSGKNAAS